ncbi:hypothetical protein CQ025_10325 [Pseudomonas sp. MYb3]|nr:hypothetical protein CQ025_10325 [Pseudomonas sp. MYb3]
MTVILPGARSNDRALVGTNLLRVAWFPTGIDQVGIFIDWADAIASRLTPAFGMRSPVGVSLLAMAPLQTPPIPQAKMISPTLAHFPPVS